MTLSRSPRVNAANSAGNREAGSFRNGLRGARDFMASHFVCFVHGFIWFESLTLSRDLEDRHLPPRRRSAWQPRRLGVAVATGYFFKNEEKRKTRPCIASPAKASAKLAHPCGLRMRARNREKVLRVNHKFSPFVSASARALITSYNVNVLKILPLRERRKTIRHHCDSEKA